MDQFETLEYPYMKEYKMDIEEWLNIVKNFKPIIYQKVPEELSKIRLLQFEDKYFIIKDEFFVTENINRLTDYYTEKWRVQCSVRKNISPLDYWTKNKSKVISKCIDKYGELSVFNLREIMYESARLCNNFKISVCLAVLGFFKPSKWLDISAGWGDRLISAIISKHIEYYESTDPNISLQEGYNNIKKDFLLEENRSNYIVHPTGFLEAELSRNDFDFVFSSPPFFDQEIYSSFENDSITTFSNNESWVDNFMIPSLRKCKDHLIENGIMVIYIHFEEYLNNALKEFDDTMERLGSLYFYDHDKPRHMYVWRKKTV